MAVWVSPSEDAEIEADTAEVTELAESVNVALVEPAETTTEGGTTAAFLLEESSTTVPPDGAALPR